MINKEVSKELLSAIQLIVSSTKGQDLNDQLITELSKETNNIMSFFNVTHFQAIVLAIYLECGLKDIDVDTEKLIDYFGKNMSSLADINQAIEELIEKKLVYVKRIDYGNKRKSVYNKVVHVNHKALDAMMKGDRDLLNVQHLDNFIELLGEVKDLIAKRVDGSIGLEVLIQEIKALIESNKDFPECEWLISQDDFTNNDFVFLLAIAIEHLDGTDEVDFDNVLRDIFSEMHQRIRFKRIIKEQKSCLFKKKLIEFADEQFLFMNYVKLTDQTMDILLGGFQDAIKKEFHPKMGNLIHPDKIAQERLFYNELELEQIDTLARALDQDNYKQLVADLTLNGVKSGITVLLYGYPGTGKTSSVKQIAKNTGRSIFMIEIPKVQSKWVGESEKNLAKIFSEYKQLTKTLPTVPILLFNEADAILGTRMSVQSSVDKSYNALQNILLQELEDFEGIFMATTNLADQLDTAFDRRLLYKIEFKKPESTVRQYILSNFFPDFSNDVIEQVNHQFSLTGGQIANIKKKLLVKSLLDKGVDRESYLLKLCREELVLNKSERVKIGFVK